ncbi:hypothetical protein BgiMline_021654, partial [Biomphalaria glabrata]
MLSTSTHDFTSAHLGSKKERAHSKLTSTIMHRLHRPFLHGQPTTPSTQRRPEGMAPQEY